MRETRNSNDLNIPKIRLEEMKKALSSWESKFDTKSKSILEENSRSVNLKITREKTSGLKNLIKLYCIFISSLETN